MADKFIEMRDKVTQFIEKLMENNKRLFLINLNKDELYATYLKSMSDELNPFFRKATTHDCSCCRGFIKSVGAVIAIKDCKVTTIWDCDVSGTGYEDVFKAMSKYVKKQINNIEGPFISPFEKQGCHHNFEEMENVGRHMWSHFYVELKPNCFIKDELRRNKIHGDICTDHQVFKRALDEISLDAIDSVLDLISTNSLYKGEEYKRQVTEFKKFKKEYDKLTKDIDKNLYSWEKVVGIDQSISRIKNTAIGTLLVDVSEGRDLDAAVSAYEKITAPENYKRSKPIFTQAMLDNAKKKIEELGFQDSLPRRHAMISDLTVNDTLFVDRKVRKSMKDGADIFDQLSKDAKSTKGTKFSGVEEITPEKFISEVLPNTTKLELYLENQHKGNFVSLIAPQNPEAPSMFKWGNGFTWAYSGNVTDSMKERVKAAGGNVDGILRFSIQWNENGKDNVDLDAHCKEANGCEIYFGSYKAPAHSMSGGQLDVDIIHPNGQIAVENIYWKDTRKLAIGDYRFFVNQYSGSVKEGFRAQIEMAGELYEFNYPHSMRSGENVDVAIVHWDGSKFTIKPKLESNRISTKIWNLDTLNFVPVQLVCFSPNYWETAKTQVGHKHLFFMLKDCINDENPSGIFNEFLVNELAEVRKVMEAIANKMRVADTNDQLSGVGFALDKRAEVVVKVTGANERLLKIKF
jgi:hypothetical protein